MADLPVETHTDAAGDLWFTLPGDSDKSLTIGGHIDSVPFHSELIGFCDRAILETYDLAPATFCRVATLGRKWRTE